MPGRVRLPLPTLAAHWLQAAKAPLAAGAATLALAVAAAGLAWAVAMATSVARAQEAALRRLDVVAADLIARVSRFDYLPALLETTPAVVALLAAPADMRGRDAANLTLNRINAIAGADMVFVLDPAGNALAAADWDQPATPVGHNYAYRPYMQQALKTGRGRFFGVGATSRRAGYFLSYALRNGVHTLGVATVKVDLEPSMRMWSSLPGAMLATDARGVVVLSSREDWRFRASRPLTAAERDSVRSERSYDPDPPALSWEPVQAAMFAGERVRFDGDEHLLTRRSLAGLDWQILALEPIAPLRASARNAAWMAALAAAVAGLLLTAAWQSRRVALNKLQAQAALQAAYDTLETHVQERTAQLRTANATLAAEIETRKAVEQNLHDTRNELVHAARMAVLGQISASLAHELNQPLAALRTLSDNAVVLLDKDRLPEARGNLERISQMVGRLGEISRRLKSFAHKPDDHPVPVPVRAAVANAHGLLAERLRRAHVVFEVDIVPETLTVLADPTLVEQVLVNLLANALDAVAGVRERLIRVQARADDKLVRIVVSDSGPGIAPEILPHLFEAFATTKPRGSGLGLGLTISRRIVRELGGQLVAVNRPGGGACFEIELPAPPTGSST